MQYKRSRIRQFPDTEQQICARHYKRKAEYLAQIPYADRRQKHFAIRPRQKRGKNHAQDRKKQAGGVQNPVDK